MKKIYIFILTVSVFLILSCSNTKSKEQQAWDQIKSSQDFAKHFNFALSIKDCTLLKEVTNSLKILLPQDEFLVLINHPCYKIDSFAIFDSEIPCLKGCIISIEIDKKDIVTSDYYSYKHKHFSSLILEFNRNRYDSINFPEIGIKNINNIEFDFVKMGVSIYVSMHPDSLQRKTSWQALIKTTKEVINAFNEAKEERAAEEFGRSLKNLTKEESITIDKIIPGLIFIHFRERWKAPPPNLSPTPEPLPLNLKDYK